MRAVMPDVAGRRIKVAHDSEDVDQLIGEYIDSFIEEENERNELVAHTLDAISGDGNILLQGGAATGDGQWDDSAAGGVDEVVNEEGRARSPPRFDHQRFHSPKKGDMGQSLSPHRSTTHSRLQNAGDGLSVFRSLRGEQQREGWKLAYKSQHQLGADLYLLELQDIVFNLQKQFDKLEAESFNARSTQDSVITHLESKLAQTQKVLALRMERTKALESERSDYKMRYNEASRQLKNLQLQAKIMIPAVGGGVMTKSQSMRRAPSMVSKK